MLDATAAPETAAPHFNPWYEISGVGVAVIEASWVVLLFQSLNETAASSPTALVFGYFAFVFYAGYLLVRGLNQARLVQTMARWLMLLLYVGLTWLGIRLLIPAEISLNFDPFTTSLRGIGEVTQMIPARFWIIPFLLWLFLRGASAARQGVGIFSVQRHFRTGVIMFLAYSALAFASVRELPGLEMFIVFLFATLLAMAAARVSILGRLRGGRRSPFSGSWFGSMAAAVAGTVAAGFTVALLTTGRFLTFYRQVVTGALLAVITLTLAPFLFILGLFAGTSVQPIAAPPPTPALPPWEQDPGYTIDLSEMTIEQLETVPQDYRLYFYGTLALVGVVVTLLLFFGVRTISRQRQEQERTEYILKRGDLVQELREAFARRARDLRDSLFGTGSLAERQKIVAAERIRQIYTELIELAVTFGKPRDPAQTPLEYALVLQRTMPAAAGEITQLTQAYLKIRYGELPERGEEVQEVERSWVKVQQAAESVVEAYQVAMKNEEKERKRMEQIR